MAMGESLNLSDLGQLRCVCHFSVCLRTAGSERGGSFLQAVEESEPRDVHALQPSSSTYWGRRR